MFSQLRMREEQALLAQDYALEQAEEKGLERGRAEGIEQGLERGLERGRAEGIEQGIEKGLAQGLERGRAEGIEQGLKVGLVNLVRQGLLTPEVASRQLGMTVAEFEALLKNHHK
ncbi:hypothetical protein E3V90_08900 [Streptococcus pseudopneumoniae]|nr:hypothetical protein E3V90_08900 [Streptococcus pseudopneumoniae]